MSEIRKMKNPAASLALAKNGAEDVHQLRGFLKQRLPNRALAGISISINQPQPVGRFLGFFARRFDP
jgi:hypothetical protein